MGTRIPMGKAVPSRTAATVRKAPRQQRSEATVAAIIEASARVLERKGFDGFNTNAVAEDAGVSIGSLYQYFPSKQALLGALIEREMQPLLRLADEVSEYADFRTGLRCYVRASVRNQMRRPELARLLDLAEKREVFSDQVSSTAARLLAIMIKILKLPEAPRVSPREDVAADLIAIIKGLVDVAGERQERHTTALEQRIERSLCGYLRVS